jgi:hypothetical protein
MNVFSCQYDLEGIATSANIYRPMSRLVNFVCQPAIRTGKISIGFQNHLAIGCSTNGSVSRLRTPNIGLFHYTADEYLTYNIY